MNQPLPEGKYTRNYRKMDPEKRAKTQRWLKEKYGVTTAAQVTPELVETIILKKYPDRWKERGFGNMVLGFFVAFKDVMMTPEEAQQHAKDGPWMILPG